MVDMKKMKRGYQREQRGGEYLTLQQGETLLYIHPQCRPDDKWEPTDGVNYVPVVVHYGVGRGAGGKGGKSKGAMVASLNPELNPIIEHPFIKRYLKKRKVKLTGKCPVEKLLSSGDLDDDELNDMRASTQYMWGVTPLAHRGDSSEEWRKLTPKPSILKSGKTVFDGVMEVFFDNGDITDPMAAILVIVGRDGKDMTTKYKVRADPESLKKHKKLSKEVRAALTKAMKEDGDCDLFKVVASMIKSPAEVEALISGVKTDEDPDDDWDDDEDEDDTKSKKSKGKGKGKKKPEPEPEPEDDDDEDDGESELEDDDEDDEPPPDDDEDDGESDLEDDDEDSEDDDEDSEDGDEPPADDDEDDDESPEDDEDEDDEPPPAKSKKSKGKDKAKKSEDDDDDDLGLDEIDAELDRIAKKGGKDKGDKKAAKKSKGKAKK